MIRRLIWQLAYARLCLASGYQFSFREAWREACEAWENQQQRGEHDPIETPAEAIRFDKREWMTR